MPPARDVFTGRVVNVPKIDFDRLGGPEFVRVVTFPGAPTTYEAATPADIIRFQRTNINPATIGVGGAGLDQGFLNALPQSTPQPTPSPTPQPTPSPTPGQLPPQGGPLTFNPTINFPNPAAAGVGDFANLSQTLLGGQRSILDVIKDLTEQNRRSVTFTPISTDLSTELLPEELAQAVAEIQRTGQVPAWAMRTQGFTVNIGTDADPERVQQSELRPTTILLQNLATNVGQSRQFREQLDFELQRFEEQQRQAEVGETFAGRQQTEQERATAEAERVQALLLFQSIEDGTQKRDLARKQWNFAKIEARYARGARTEEFDQRVLEAKNNLDLAERELDAREDQLDEQIRQFDEQKILQEAGLSGTFGGSPTLEAELGRRGLSAREREANIQSDLGMSQLDLASLQRQDAVSQFNRQFGLQQALAGGMLPSNEQSLEAELGRGQLGLGQSQLDEQIRQFDEQNLLQRAGLTGIFQGAPTLEAELSRRQLGLQEAGLSGIFGGQPTLEAELSRRQLGLGEQQADIAGALGFGQLEQARQALEAQQARAALEAQTSLTQSAFANPAGFGAFRSLGGLGQAPPQAQNPMVQQLAGLNFQIPQTPQGQPQGITPTAPRAFFPKGIPTLGSLAQTPSSGLDFLTSVLGMTGTTPSQFGRMAASITPSAQPAPLPAVLRRGRPAVTRA